MYREECRNEACGDGDGAGDGDGDEDGGGGGRTYLRTFDVTATKPHNGRHRHKTGRTCDDCGAGLYTLVEFNRP